MLQIKKYVWGPTLFFKTSTTCCCHCCPQLSTETPQQQQLQQKRPTEEEEETRATDVFPVLLPKKESKGHWRTDRQTKDICCTEAQAQCPKYILSLFLSQSVTLEAAVINLINSLCILSLPFGWCAPSLSAPTSPPSSPPPSPTDQQHSPETENRKQWRQTGQS